MALKWPHTIDRYREGSEADPASARHQAKPHRCIMRKDMAMQRLTTVLQMCGVITVLGLTSLALPLPVHARVNVSVGIGVPVVVAPVPVVVAPAPVMVVPPPGSWVGNTMASLIADTTIEDTIGTRIDMGDIMTTTGTAGKQENTSCGTAEDGWLESLAGWCC